MSKRGIDKWSECHVQNWINGRTQNRNTRRCDQQDSNWDEGTTETERFGDAIKRRTADGYDD